MKKVYLIIGCFLIVIAVAAIMINFHLAHKTRFMPLSFYDIETKSLVAPAYIEVVGLDINGADKIKIDDEQLIQKILEYLKNIPLVYSSEKEMPLAADGKSASLTFYNERRIVNGWIWFRGEEYLLSGINMQTYKAQDEGTPILSGLQEIVAEYIKQRSSPDVVLESSPTIPPAPELSGEPLTAEELAWLSYEFSYPAKANARSELMSFLRNEYNTPAEVDPNDVFFVGTTILDKATDKEMDYLASLGNFHIPIDWREHMWEDGRPIYGVLEYLLRLSNMDDVFKRRLGLTLSELERAYISDSSDKDRYWIPEYEAYFVRGGDWNIITVDFLSGQYMGDDTYVLEYYTDWLGSLSGQTCRVTFTMTNNDPDTIMFISNVKIG